MGRVAGIKPAAALDDAHTGDRARGGFARGQASTRPRRRRIQLPTAAPALCRCVLALRCGCECAPSKHGGWRGAGRSCADSHAWAGGRSCPDASEPRERLCRPGAATPGGELVFSSPSKCVVRGARISRVLRVSGWDQARPTFRET